MADTGTEPEDVWGPIVLTNWRETLCLKDRFATEDDVKVGRAVFYLDLSEGQESHPVALNREFSASVYEVFGR
jgi:hypothetical protein